MKCVDVWVDVVVMLCGRCGNMITLRWCYDDIVVLLDGRCGDMGTL